MENENEASRERLANEIGISPEALEFVQDALQFTPQYSGDEPGDFDVQVRHCTANEFCRASILFTKDTFGNDYVAALKLWDLDTSEKLGQVIYDLISLGRMQGDEGETQADFDGQFNLTAE